MLRETMDPLTVRREKDRVGSFSSGSFERGEHVKGPLPRLFAILLIPAFIGFPSKLAFAEDLRPEAESQPQPVLELVLVGWRSTRSGECGREVLLEVVLGPARSALGSLRLRLPLDPSLLPRLKAALGPFAYPALRLILDGLRAQTLSTTEADPASTDEDEDGDSERGSQGPALGDKTPKASSRSVPSTNPCLDLVRGLLPYRVLPGVLLEPEVEAPLGRLAERFLAATGRRLVFTSGMRTPEAQAQAMLQKIHLGQSLVRLYRKQDAIRELLAAYRGAQRAGHGKGATIAILASMLRAQMRRGVYLSLHLRSGAVDMRTRNLTPRDRRIFRRLVSEFHELYIGVEERVPPHIHLEVYPDPVLPPMAIIGSGSVGKSPRIEGNSL